MTTAVLPEVTEFCDSPDASLRFDWCERCKRECGLPHEFVEKTARGVYERWREWAEYEDVEQEIWVAFLGDPIRYWELIHGTESDQQLAWVILSRAAGKYCRKERDARYHIPDDYGYKYSKRMLRALLPGVFGGDVAAERSASVQPSGGASSGSSDVDTMWIDVREGLSRLDKDDRVLLFDVYASGEAASTHPKYVKAQGALKRLQKELGGDDDSSQSNM